MECSPALNRECGLSPTSMSLNPCVAKALALLAQGMDFADALHLSGCGHCEALYTFDNRRFARRAQRLATEPKVMVPTV